MQRNKEAAEAWLALPPFSKLTAAQLKNLVGLNTRLCAHLAARVEDRANTKYKQLRFQLRDLGATEMEAEERVNWLACQGLTDHLCYACRKRANSAMLIARKKERELVA